ncbi:hypothetical protein C7T94_06050 [Pedobacter yulinensis]|uniref:Bacterial bifunctional deaminase-reductase C-terminal domain-containing protein n=1 Tax=Pedobacter yulinensis TaxID=2126353 RepID=A0A2T3HPG8_9SPHI|nr:hypothetical protein C7T94_06050 [Pedobacter yulinensis]
MDLARTLLPTGLIDELSLFVCPTMLGRGRPLFPAGQPSGLRLEFRKSFGTGVVLHHYSLLPGPDK